MATDLAAARRRASELSGGTSSDVIKDLVVRLVEAARGDRSDLSLLDYGAGRGELLNRLHATGHFAELAGADLFARPDSLPPGVGWYEQDLNDTLRVGRQFDIVVCSETVEHLENPRHTFRCLAELLKPGGTLVLTMPNQESLRSYLGFLLAGHHIAFLAGSYPAHITALVRLDLTRLCGEAGLSPPAFAYTGSGCVPKMTFLTWQRVSLGLLRGRLFSDNVGMVATKPR